MPTKTINMTDKTNELWNNLPKAKRSKFIQDMLLLKEKIERLEKDHKWIARNVLITDILTLEHNIKMLCKKDEHYYLLVSTDDHEYKIPANEKMAREYLHYLEEKNN